MALADVFDALTCRRVYKKAMDFDQATQLITAGRGTHFDPDVVDAFLACHDQFVRIATQFQDDAVAQETQGRTGTTA